MLKNVMSEEVVLKKRIETLSSSYRREGLRVFVQENFIIIEVWIS
jgi:hypothetical protein